MKRTVMLAMLALAVIGLIATLTVQAPAGGRKDPLPAANFRVEIDGIASSSFSEVSGLSCVTEVVEYRDGTDPNRVRLLPAETRCGPIVLRRGLTTNMELWDWHQSIVDGVDDRRSMSVIVMKRDRSDVARFNFHDCFVSSWTLPTLDGKSSDVALEEVVIVCEIMEWE